MARAGVLCVSPPSHLAERVGPAWEWCWGDYSAGLQKGRPGCGVPPALCRSQLGGVWLGKGGSVPPPLSPLAEKLGPAQGQGWDNLPVKLQGEKPPPQGSPAVGGSQLGGPWLGWRGYHDYQLWKPRSLGRGGFAVTVGAGGMCLTANQG